MSAGPPRTVAEAFERLGAGDATAIARAISWMEAGDPRADDLLAAIAQQPASPFIVGITGPPGAGKSTLVDALAAHWAASGQKLGVLAIDPSSPLTGGAILGDRLRMVRSAQTGEVFVRSLAARGKLGGIADAAWSAAAILAAAGRTTVLVETVGVGQADVDIGQLADVVVMVTAPGLGDEIQAMKAGLLEIAHVVVVNKGDLPGAQAAVHAFRQVARTPGSQRAAMPVLTVCAEDGKGVSELAELLEAIRDERSRDGGCWLEFSNRWAAQQLETELGPAASGWVTDRLGRSVWPSALSRVASTGSAHHVAIELLEAAARVPASSSSEEE